MVRSRTAVFRAWLTIESSANTRSSVNVSATQCETCSFQELTGPHAAQRMYFGGHLIAFCVFVPTLPSDQQRPPPPPAGRHLPFDLTKCCKLKAAAGAECSALFAQCSCNGSTTLARAVRDASIFKDPTRKPTRGQRYICIYTFRAILSPTSDCAFSDRFRFSSSLPQEFSAKTTGNFETILGGYATQTAADRNFYKKKRAPKKKIEN